MIWNFIRKNTKREIDLLEEKQLKIPIFDKL
jgi:hypothetical protein